MKISFYPQFIRTFDDLPGHISLLIHSWNGCNMRCYGCHNYETLIATRPDRSSLTAKQTIDRLAGCGDLFDAVLLSGGEFLMNERSVVVQFLTEIRCVFSGKVVVFTNGTYPRKLFELLDNKLIDGAHLDLKLPFHCLDPEEDRDIFEAIIGVAPSQKYCEDILESAHIIIRHNSPVSQIRTVRYPLLSEPYFDLIREYVSELNGKFQSSVPYYLNPYQSPNGGTNDVSSF